MIAGAAAIGFQLDPSLTPNRIKALLQKAGRSIAESGVTEVSLSQAAQVFGQDGGALANQGLTPNTLVDAATGDIDYARSSWSRSSWSNASDLLRSSWSRSSWSCSTCGGDSAAVDPSRSSWSRSSWSTSWTK
jgi:serine protease AprX